MHAQSFYKVNFIKPIYGTRIKNLALRFILSINAKMHIEHQDRRFQILKRNTVHDWVEILFLRLHPAHADDLPKEGAEPHIVFHLFDFGCHARTSVFCRCVNAGMVKAAMASRYMAK